MYIQATKVGLPPSGNAHDRRVQLSDDDVGWRNTFPGLQAQYRPVDDERMWGPPAIPHSPSLSHASWPTAAKARPCPGATLRARIYI
jgi:hypothetical protein